VEMKGETIAMPSFEIIRLQAKTRLRDDAACALAIGNFDGLHIGHQTVLQAMCRYANAHQLVPSVLTFYPHPRYYFVPKTPAFLLQHYRNRLAGFRDLGIKRIYIAHFNADLVQMSAQDFCEQMLFKTCHAKAIFTGENFAFGAGRSGNVASLQALTAQHNLHSEAIKSVMRDGQVSSSSLIRKALAKGDVISAAQALGRHYTLSGRVQKGDGRGASIGFATANIYPRHDQLIPALGVYAVRVRDGDYNHYDGVANLGIRPTFGGDDRPRLEVHLFDVNRDFLGQRLEVSLIDFIRPEICFDGVGQLKTQIAKDCETARAMLAHDTPKTTGESA
jgi:riboflavin kinase/FMN adenylyltransferase